MFLFSLSQKSHFRSNRDLLLFI